MDYAIGTTFTARPTEKSDRVYWYYRDEEGEPCVEFEPKILEYYLKHSDYPDPLFELIQELSFTVVYLGTHIKWGSMHNAFQIVITRKGKYLSFPFHMGTGNKDIPTIYNILFTLRSESNLEEEWLDFDIFKGMSLSEASIELAEISSYVKSINDFFSKEEINLLPY